MKGIKIMINEYMSKIIDENSHLLIAGTTGSGKSTLLNSLIAKILQNQIEEKETYKFYLIDPKRVELSFYKNLEIVQAYGTENKQALHILDDLIELMEQRYKRMEIENIRNIRYKSDHIYLVIDEIADLMLTCKKHFQPKLQRLLALGRAANITIIAATQIPARKVIPAELSCNFPQKIGLRCISCIESRQIINQKGCEYLPRFGSGLWLSSQGIEQIKIPLTNDNDLNNLIISINNSIMEKKRQPATFKYYVPTAEDVHI